MVKKGQLKKVIKRKIAMLITSFFMSLLKLGITPYIKSNWLLRQVPSLMGWSQIKLETPVIKELPDHAKSKAV